VEILGIGPMELILILIVALMVFGPDRLPQFGAKLGRAMRDMRRATRAISDEINSTRAAIEAPAKELAEPFKDVTDAAKAAGAFATAARNPGQAIRESVLRELNAPAESQKANETAGEENRIAPPAAGEPGREDEGTTASTALSEPAPALPAPEEPLAALPAPGETSAAPESDLPAGAETPDPGEDTGPEDEQTAISPTSPEQ
jgi:TatA/E family protein of Tat protein translocase